MARREALQAAGQPCEGQEVGASGLGWDSHRVITSPRFSAHPPFSPFLGGVIVCGRVSERETDRLTDQHRERAREVRGTPLSLRSPASSFPLLSGAPQTLSFLWASCDCLCMHTPVWCIHGVHGPCICGSCSLVCMVCVCVVCGVCVLCVLCVVCVCHVLCVLCVCCACCVCCVCGVRCAWYVCVVCV